MMELWILLGRSFAKNRRRLMLLPRFLEMRMSVIAKMDNKVLDFDATWKLVMKA